MSDGALHHHVADAHIVVLSGDPGEESAEFGVRPRTPSGGGLRHRSEIVIVLAPGW